MASRKTKTTTMKMTEPPLLGERRLDCAHLDQLHQWLAKSPTNARRQRLQADILAWSPVQRGLAGARGLNGLWRATQVIRSESTLEVDQPDYDDIEGIEAANDPKPDEESTWSDAHERLFYFLEIRGRSFRELDASVYPIAVETHEFDSDTLDYVVEATKSDAVAGAVYYYWTWAIKCDENGFAEFAEYAAPYPAKTRQGRRRPPKWAKRSDKSEILLNYHDADEHLIDRIREVNADTLERRIFLLADGVYTSSIHCTYERFAVPLDGAEELAPVENAKKATKKSAKKTAPKAAT